ncbi:MAG: hypothetical protein M1821_005506 [Bathelium mastoideum]|nr:MAG: hypothetical protein M1821_005506 [Bathelium mastoideum]KAI9691835.1 MAG: hypothetical protein M1822_007907 [Bathelium mastoideum]
MSTSQSQEQPTTKKFGKGERVIPHPSQKASKYYPAEDVTQRKKSRKVPRPFKPRPSLQPGAVLILLAGRFRGKRVVLLKVLDQGVLLVTGPFKVNGVPLRRVNSRYVIATSTKVNLAGVDSKILDKVGNKEYFAREKEDKKQGEEAFFKQGEKPEKKEVSKSRVEDQKAVDKALIGNVKKEPFLLSYLASSFSLRKGDKPHEMVF